METNRILLRPWRESDAEALFKWASDPDVGERAGWPPHKSVEESLKIIKTLFNNDTTWAIVLKDTGEPNEQDEESLSNAELQDNNDTGEPIGAIGYGPSCDCNLPAREGEPLTGYWVAKPYWNQEICTEALKLMIEHIRNTTDIKSLISGHFIDNPASGRVMEKCGFVPTGETCIDPNQYQGEDRPIRVMRLELENKLAVIENNLETPKKRNKPKVLNYLIKKKKRAALMRAFHIWQKKPHVVAPLSDTINKCSSCGTEFQGNYCPRCGQSASVGRFSFKRALMHFLDVWGMGNRSMFRSMRDLILRPGYMIRDYLRGMQSAYFPPFKMFFVLLAISLFLEHGFSLDSEATDEKSTKYNIEIVQQENNEAQEASDKANVSTTGTKEKNTTKSAMYNVGDTFAKFLKKMKKSNPAIFSLLSLLIFSWPLFFFLRKSPNIPDLRFSEFIIALVYTANSYTIFSIVSKLLGWFFFDFIALFMIFVALHQFSGYKKRRILFYMILSLIISVITLFVIGLAGLGITYLFVSK